MKKAASAVVALLFLFVATACGSSEEGLTEEEQKIADNIAQQLAEPEGEDTGSGGTLAKKDATCFAEKFVAAAGVADLKKSKLVNDDGEVQETGATFDEKLSEKYADAYLECVDFAAEVASTFAASDPAIDEKKLASCLEEELPESLVKQVIVDTRSAETANSEQVADANKKVADCQQAARDGAGDKAEEKDDKGNDKGDDKADDKDDQQ